MDGCDLDKAFLSGPVGSAGCDGRGTAEESRRQEKKKARRCRGPAGTYLNQGWNMVGAVDTDPDRPAQKRMDDLPALNAATGGILEHAPVTQQYAYEGFVGEMDSLPKNLKGPTALQGTATTPSFFGASPEDSGSAMKHRKGNSGLTEAFTSQVAPFVDVIGSQEEYKLLPDFGKAFGKASSGGASSGAAEVGQETSYLTPSSMLPNSILPVPNVNVFWKENGIAGGQSSFFSQLKAPGGQPSGVATDPDAAGVDVPASRREVLTKLDKIFARLDDMEAAKSENAQTEVLLFILTGVGIIFLMDIGCRAAMSARR